MNKALISILPLFAPLPSPVVQHLLLGKRRSHRRAVPPLLLNDFERETGYTQAEWNQLLQEVFIARQTVYAQMAPLIPGNALSTPWLLRSLKAATPRKNSEDSSADEERNEIPEEISQSTLDEWKDRGLISYKGRNRPDTHEAAALLIARLVDKRIRNWLPTSMTPVERQAWCWQQDTPESMPVSCPLPLPADLPHATLFTSIWEGQAWDSCWRQISGIGAARWFGVREKNGQELWNLTLEDIQLWDPQSATLDIFSASMSSGILHELANVALIRLALLQLGLTLKTHDLLRFMR